MNPAALFINRPVATTLLTLGVALAGILAFTLLPVSPLPQIDYPTIAVQVSLSGASPDTMAATVATPLERSLGVIAGVSELTSSSSLGTTRITLQFDLSRDINGAARDVQAALNAAIPLLPSGLTGNPTYRKVNPADAPIMILSLTSNSMSRAQMYDAASTILAQKISQLDGVGQVTAGGASLPAVRVELSPPMLNQMGIGVEAVRTAIAATNANRPKGAIEDDTRHWQVLADDQAKKAVDYIPLIIGYNKGAAVRLGDVASVVDAQQDIRNDGLVNGKPAVMLIINRQPGANIIETVDRVRALLPQLRASIPGAIELNVAMDRTPTIRSSLHEVERTLAMSVALVVMVVFLFLRNARAALIPSVVVPVSLIGTFAVMYLAGFSLNTLSLMALTIATGFVVDDAVVVLENVSRYIEDGVSPFEAALRGAREVGFTVLSMRNRRAIVPRVCRHAFRRHPGLPGHVADHHADDVRAPVEAQERRKTRAFLSCERTDFRRRVEQLSHYPGLGARARAHHDADTGGYGRLQHLPVQHHTEGLLSAAGRGTPVRHCPGRPEHFLPAHEGKNEKLHGHRARRPGGG
jgi:multidrug efflux pump